MFLGIMIVYSIIIIPYRIGFNVSMNQNDQNFDYFLDSAFFLDMLFTFNMPLQDPDSQKYIMNRTTIALTYLQFWFWIDLFSSLPIDDIFSAFTDGAAGNANSVRLVRVLRLIRLVKLVRFFKLQRIMQHVEGTNINPSLLGVGTLVSQIFFVAHLISCFWYYLTTTDVTDSASFAFDQLITWRTEFGYINSTTSDAYIASFYWCVTTMLAVGYGDIHATNANERAYTIFTILAGGIMFGAVIAQVTKLIESRNPQAKAFKEKMNEIKAYLADTNLPFKLILRAKGAYTYYLTKKSSFGESSITEKLSRPLLIKLINNVYENEIRQIKLFRDSIDPSFMVQLLTNIQPFEAIRGEVIFTEGDVAEDMGFIMRGMVSINVNSAHGSIIAGYSEEGGYFGDFEYYKKSTRLATYQAAINCTLLGITYAIFDSASDAHYDAGEVFKAEIKARYEAFRLVVKKANARAAVFEDQRRKQQQQQQHPQQQIAVSDMTAKAATSAALRASERLSLGKLYGFGSSEAPVKDANPMVEQAGADSDDLLWVDGEAQLASSVHLLDTLSNTKIDDKLYRVIVVGAKEDGSPELLMEESLDQMSNRYMLHPDYSYKRQWDFSIVFLILYSVIAVPVQIGFGREAAGAVSIWDDFVDCMFFTDLLLSIRTAYFSAEDDAWVLVPFRVWFEYAKTWFWIDLLSSIPFDTLLLLILGSGVSNISSVQLVKTIRLTRLVKLVRLVKLSKYVNRVEDMLGVSPATFDLMKLVIEVGFIAHMVCCLWWGVCSNTGEYSWIDDPFMVYRSNLRDGNLGDQYLFSLYWTFVTLATVGYGDITAVNSVEQMVCVFIMMVGATVFGYIVANVATLMGSKNLAEEQTNEKIAEVTEYLREKQVPKSLTGAIVRHVKHAITQVSAFDEEGILSRLPRSISTEIQLIQQNHIMSLIPIFKFISNGSICLYIYKLLSPAFFDTNQYVVHQGANGGEIVFIVDGRVRLYQSTAPTSKHNGRKGKKSSKGKGSIKRVMSTNRQNSNEVDTQSPPQVKRDISYEELSKHGHDIDGQDVKDTQALLDRDSYSNIPDDAIATWRDVEMGDDLAGHVGLTLESLSTAPTDNGHSHVDGCDFDGIAMTNLTSTHEGNHDPAADESQAHLLGASQSIATNPSNSVSKKSNKRPSLFSSWKAPASGASVTSDKASSSRSHGLLSPGRLAPALSSEKDDGDPNSVKQSTSQKSFVIAKVDRKGPLKRSTEISESSSTSSDSEKDTQSLLEVKANSMKRSGSVDSMNDARYTMHSLASSMREKMNTIRRKVPFSKQTDDDHRRKGRIVLGELTKGDFFGHVAMMNNGRYSASVRAIQPCSVYTLKRSDIIRLLRDQPSVGLQLQIALSQAIYENANELQRLHVANKRKTFAAEAKSSFIAIKNKKYAMLNAKQSPSMLKKASDLLSGKQSVASMGFLSATNARAGNKRPSWFKRLRLSQACASALPAPIARLLPVTPRRKSKWSIIRRAIRDAKLAAQLAAWKDDEGRPEDKDVSAKRNGESLFTLALQARLSGNLDRIFNDQMLDYDSDDQERTRLATNLLSDPTSKLSDSGTPKMSLGSIFSGHVKAGSPHNIPAPATSPIRSMPRRGSFSLPLDSSNHEVTDAPVQANQPTVKRRGSSSDLSALNIDTSEPVVTTAISTGKSRGSMSDFISLSPLSLTSPDPKKEHSVAKNAEHPLNRAIHSTRSTSDLLGLEHVLGNFTDENLGTLVHEQLRPRSNSWPSADYKYWKIKRTKPIFI